MSNKCQWQFCENLNKVLWFLQAKRAALESNVNIELYNALHYHMANGRLLTKDLKDGLTVTSMYNDLGLYINHYPNGVKALTGYKILMILHILKICQTVCAGGDGELCQDHPWKPSGH